LLVGLHQAGHAQEHQEEHESGHDGDDRGVDRVPSSASTSRTTGAMSDTAASSISRDWPVRGGPPGFGSESARIDGCSAAAPQHA
jgi:hypothetical protein